MLANLKADAHLLAEPAMRSLGDRTDRTRAELQAL